MNRGLLPRRLPLALVSFGGRHPKTVIIVAVLAWLMAAVLATRLRVETDILSLVPRDNPVVQAFATTIERFGTVDTLLVVLRIDDDIDIEAVVDFAETLAVELGEWDQIDWVEFRISRGAEAAVPLLDRSTLFLDSVQIDDLLERLTDKGLPIQAEQMRANLLAPQSVATKDLLRLDPMGMLATILAKARFGGIGLTVDPETGCIVDRNRRLLLMLAKPVRPAQDLEFDRLLLDGLSARVDAAAVAWESKGWEGLPPAVEFTGGYVVVLSDSRLITSDAVVGAVSALIGVLVLFLFAFRKPSTLAFAFFPLVTGLGLALVFVSLYLGRLNSLTSASGGLLIGLGIDFVIVLYARYVDERGREASHWQALDAMGRHTGLGVLLGAVTTAATFYAFLVTDFQGLSELGLLTGTGILLLMVSVFLLLPALLTVVYGGRAEVPRLNIHSFGSHLLCRASLARPTITLLLAGLLTVLAIAGTTALEFDDDIQNMRSKDNPGIALREEVMAAFGARLTPLTVRVDGRDEGEALERARELLPGIEALVDDGTLASVDAIAGIVPPLEDQLAVIARLRQEQGRLDGVDGRLAAALADAGLNPAAFADGLRHLRNALGVERPLALSDLDGTPLERVVDRYVATYDGGVSTAIYCYPPAGRWRRQAPPALEMLVDRHEWAVLAAPVVVSAELRRIVWRDAAWASVIGMVAVFLLMWADLGSAIRALVALLPLALGMVWMLGSMALLGLRVNFMNIFVMTMVIGIGVDYGVHLLHRWHETDGDADALSATAKAIAVAALTTIVGFGSLVLSHFPGLRSVGAAAILGALFTAIASITVLPVVLAKLGGK